MTKAPPPPSSPDTCRRTARSCRLYDEHGLILETSTHLEDILMSDYFQIDDRCVVQPSGDGSVVRVDVEVEVREREREHESDTAACHSSRVARPGLCRDGGG